MVYGYSLTGGTFSVYDAGSMEQIELFSTKEFTKEEFEEKVAAAIVELEQEEPYLHEVAKILVDSGEFFEVKFIAGVQVYD